MFNKDGLYDFVEITQKRHSDRQVWLIEDNVGVHRKASRLLEEERRKRNIKKIDWVANSPDLHFIEDVWLALEEYFEFIFESLTGSSAVAKEKASNVIRNAWYSEHIRWKAQDAVLKWSHKLRECVRQGGKNHFKG